VGLVERALISFKKRFREQDLGVSNGRPRINVTGLQKILESYGVQTEEGEVKRLIDSCLKEYEISRLEGGVRRKRSASQGAIDDTQENRERVVTFEELLTCTSLWKMIAVSELNGHILRVRRRTILRLRLTH